MQAGEARRCVSDSLEHFHKSLADIILTEPTELTE
jgi:hypothetical protein